MLISLGFHDVVEDWSRARPIAAGHTKIYTLDRRQFRECLAAVQLRAGSNSVRRVGQDSSREGACVCITVDDGAVSSFDNIAPELEQLGWRGHFFITTDWIGLPGFVTAAQVRDLHERGHLLGSHSCTHPKQMSAMSSQEMLREWRDSCARLSDTIGAEVNVASVPGGYYGRRVGSVAAEAGIRVLFTSEPTTRAGNVEGCRVVGRYAVRRTTPPRVVASIAAGDRRYRWQQSAAWAATKAAKKMMGKWYLPLRTALLAPKTS